MFLSKLKIWNFRKYGTKENGDSGVTVLFNERLNLIVGENDSGKTAIIDAIKLVLGTQSYDNIRLEENDFYREKNGKRSTSLKVECTFENLSDIEAGRFLEWIYIDEDGNPKLEVRVTAKLKENKIIIRKTGGKEDLDVNFEATENLRVTYLKPLRDAEHELSPGYRSRFAQVLKSHPIFKDSSGIHEIEEIMKDANEGIEKYFKVSISENNNKEIDVTEENNRDSDDTSDPSSIIKSISQTLNNFLGSDNDKYEVNINISEMELNKILSRLMLKIDEDKVGLGTLNQLYMAMELLLLDIKEKNNEFGLALIEEIEAHIHPQAQLRIIKHLEENIKSQTILTTHSITLASIANLNSLILCRNNSAYSLNKKYTRLSSGDYEFLERFLDSTKANLFFAKGVIMVEGDAENILIPTIAKIIGKPLYMYGVSIVNVGNVAFLRYSNIFISKEEDKTVGIPTSIVTDLDVRPIQYFTDEDNNNEFKGYKLYRIKKYDEYYVKEEDSRQRVKEILGKGKLDRFKKGEYQDQVEVIEDYYKYKEVIKKTKEQKYNLKDIEVFTNQWTMEFDLALSCIREYVYAAVLIARDIKLDESVIDSINLDKYINIAKEEINDFIKDGKDDMDIAYIIYKPLLKGNSSKAVCAQYLSKILMNESNINEDLVSKIIEDQNIKYILDSIYHVTNSRSEVTE